MDAADDRRDVMLAMRGETDIAQQHNLVVARDLLEGAPQMLGGVLVVAGEPLLIGAHHPGRRLEQPFAAGVVASPTNEGLNRFFSLRTRGTIPRRRPCRARGRHGGN